MLRLAILFLVIALIAALFGFGGIAGAATDIARILFFVFLVLFLASLLFGSLPALRRPPDRANDRVTAGDKVSEDGPARRSAFSRSSARRTA